MHFKHALFANFLLVSAILVLATPSSRYDARVARRRVSGRSQPNNRLEQTTDVAGTSNGVYSVNWAGALWNVANGTFTYVTATFTVPTLSGNDGTGASAWVGIDGYTCTNAVLQVGIEFTHSNGQVSYNVWYQWYPDPLQGFSGIEISAGDVIKLTVVAFSTTSGIAIVQNLSKDQSVTQKLNSTFALCEQSAEWIVEDFAQGNGLIPFANFGTVVFTDALAVGNEPYTPLGATTINVHQNNQTLTEVLIDASAVTITHV